MRRKFALLMTALLAGATMSVTAVTPAHASHCDDIITDDPIIIYSCRVVDGAPQPGPTIDHYYYTVTGAVHSLYCKFVSPYC